MQSEELFRAGYAAAVELMQSFDGPAMVTDELVEHLEENAGESYERFQQTPAWHRIQKREAESRRISEIL